MTEQFCLVEVWVQWHDSCPINVGSIEVTSTFSTEFGVCLPRSEYPGMTVFGEAGASVDPKQGKSASRCMKFVEGGFETGRLLCVGRKGATRRIQ